MKNFAYAVIILFIGFVLGYVSAINNHSVKTDRPAYGSNR